MGGIEVEKELSAANKKRLTHDDFDDFFTDEIRIAYYNYVHRTKHGRYEPKWRGRRCIKLPTDLLLYAQVIFKHQPDYIIETGTRFGGSTLFFGDMLLLSGGRHVFSIDVDKRGDLVPHPFVEYIQGSSVDGKLFKEMRHRLRDENKSVMVVLDSDHHKSHVDRELELWSRLVTKGQFIVVEDCFAGGKNPYPPFYSVRDFLEKNQHFKRRNLERQFIFAITKGGWLQRIG
ncbi:MAG: CmcI family methyltransferase [Candidatus Thorarchaeota archaeon]|jgi:cephalosporin hydroxylase